MTRAHTVGLASLLTASWGRSCTPCLWAHWCRCVVTGTAGHLPCDLTRSRHSAAHRHRLGASLLLALLGACPRHPAPCPRVVGWVSVGFRQWQLCPSACPGHLLWNCSQCFSLNFPPGLLMNAVDSFSISKVRLEPQVAARTLSDPHILA